MRSLSQSFSHKIERRLPWVVLGILLTYTLVRFIEVPYAGFDWDSNGRVSQIEVQGNTQTPLRIGDRLIQIGPISWAEFQSDSTSTLFNGTRPGQVVQLLIERDGTHISIPWKFPGLNQQQFLGRALSAFWLGYFFWLAGMLAAAHLRPRGEAANLAVAFSYLTALGCVIGGPAVYHTWGSALLLRIIIWFGVPVYWAFHWVWPLPLPRPPAVVRWGVYALAAALALGECLRIVPPRWYLVGFLLSVIGSMLLLVAHAIFQPAARLGLRRLLVVLFLALIPLLGYPVLGTAVAPAVSSSLASVGLPFIPLAYFSSLSRRELGYFEFRINRLASAYAYLVVLGLVTLPLITLAAFKIPGPTTVIIVGAAAGIISAIVTIRWYPSFQSFVERRLLQLPVSPEELVRVFAQRITSSSSLSDIASLLKADVLPGLFVRQFAFLYFRDGQVVRVLTAGLENLQIPDESALPALLGAEGGDRQGQAYGAAAPWIRVVLPLRIRDEMIGVWLLGDRDPDNEYSRSEIALLHSLADQTAVALSNIIQTQRLRELYQANVSRHEEERMNLALTLHDSILNRLAALLMKLDATAITPAFQDAYEDLSNLVRGIVSDLRPPMLTYGLKPAIEELAEDRMEGGSNRVQIATDLRAEDVRYPPLVELHLFRIVQESLGNALHHAGAATITISGHLNRREAEIRVQDDGIGFDAPDGRAIQHLIAQRHFGLAGLIERANLIGARVLIQSTPGTGTRIQVNWTSRET